MFSSSTRLCRRNQLIDLDQVSTTRGSGWVDDQHAILLQVVLTRSKPTIYGKFPMLKETHLQIRRELEREGAFGVLNLYGALTVLCDLPFLAVGLFRLLRVQPFSIPY